MKNKHHKIKRALSYLTVITILIGAFMSPYFASGAGDALGTMANYLYLQAAQECLSDAELIYNSSGDSLPIDYATSLSSESEVKTIKLNNILGFTNFVYDKTKLYNGYLELAGQNKYDDSKVYCKELAENGNAPIEKTVDAIVKQGTYNKTDLICGKNGHPGMYTIKYGYNSSKFTYREETWPEAWPATTDGVTNDCRKAVELLQTVASDNIKVASGGNYGEFFVKFIVNSNFKFSDYFKHEYDTSELDYYSKYYAFTTVCGATSITADEYNKQTSIAGNTGHYYNIYYYEKNGSGGSKYFKMDNPNRDVYYDTNIMSKAEMTCKELGNALNRGNYSDLWYKNRDALITDCFNDSYENYLSLKHLKNSINVFNNWAKSVYDHADYEFKKMNGDPIPERTDAYTMSFDLIQMNSKIEEINNDNAISGEVSALKDMYDTASSFVDSMENHINNDEHDDAVRGEIENYQENVEQFNKDVVEKINNIIDGLPSPLKNKNEAEFREMCNSGAIQCSTTSLDSGTIYNVIPDFYSFNNEEIVCSLNDSVVGNASKKIGEIVGTAISFAEYEPPKNEEINENGELEKPSCDNADLNGQNWILCSTAGNVSETATGLFKIVDRLLKVDSGLYDSDNKNGGGELTYKLWDTFRNFANVILVIILIVIIISQITGYGIDNYGIKKMLPKLFTMAILINLSYFICSIAVDISNIVGISMIAVFKHLGSNFISGSEGSAALSDILGALIGVGAGAAAGAGGAVSVGVFMAGLGAGGWIIAVVIVLLVLVIILIAILFLFIMLAIRLMTVIIAIGFAPVAMACYILPNTKSVFKKWYDIFKAALLVYPICGALYGLSFVTKGIALAAGNDTDLGFAMLLIGALASVVPYFAVITLLKKVISGLGVIGNAISGIGRTVRNSGRSGMNAARNTSGYREAMERGRDNMAAARAKRIKSKLGKLDENNLSTTQQNRLRRANEILLARDKRMEEDKIHSSKEYYSGMKEKQALELEAEKNVVKKYNPDGQYIAAQRASMEADATNREIESRLLLMRKEGITMGGGKKVSFQQGAFDRMAELAKKDNLSAEERMEVKALARGMMGIKGGGGRLGNIIRDNDGRGNSIGTTQQFRNVMAEAYNQDSVISAKMQEKDMGASIYLEHNLDGKAGSFAEFKNNGDYFKEYDSRVKFHAAGLNQGGVALDEYLDHTVPDLATINAITNNEERSNAYNKARQSIELIMNDTDFLNTLNDVDRINVQKRAAQYGISGTREQMQAQQTYEVLHDIANNTQSKPQSNPPAGTNNNNNNNQ